MKQYDDDADSEDTRRDAQAIIDFAKQSLRADRVSLSPSEEIQLLVVPEGKQVLDLKEYFDRRLPAPERRKGIARFATLDALIAHTNRFKDEDSVLFAMPDPTDPRIISVLDYHTRGATGSPRFGEHRGAYAFPLSPQWLVWTKHDGKVMAQADFAAFLEANIEDVADPTGASETSQLLADRLEVALAKPSALMSSARGLTVKVEQTVRTARNLASGEVELIFEEKHAGEGAGGKVNVPQAFMLGIPVFRGGAYYEIAVRLRYRVTNGHVAFSYNLHRADRVFDHAFGEACTRASKETGLPLYMGLPEGG